MSKFKSPVWQHFTDIDTEKKVACLYCPQTLSVANKSTCSLIRHLTKKHPHVQLERASTADTSNHEQDIFMLHKDVQVEYNKAPSPTETVIEYEIDESEPEDTEIPEIIKQDQKPSHRLFRIKPSQANIKQPAEEHVISAMTEAKRHINEALVSMKSLSSKKHIEELDEYDHFAHMIAAKIRKIQDMEERETVMNSIHNVVYQALRKNI